MSDLIHASARLCNASVPRALEHLSTQHGMSRWNLGLRQCREVEPGLFRGESLFDGGVGWVRVTVDAGRGRVEYGVGRSADALVPRIHAEVIDGARLGHAAGTCLVTLHAWRPGGMSDERWQRLVHTHETEIELIRAQLEAATIGS
jgi:hypothetical protein